MGNITTHVDLGREHDDGNFTVEIGTEFEIKKYFGTDDDSLRLLNDTEVIPFSPDTELDELFRFKVTSNHEDEYVHLEKCTLEYEGKSKIYDIIEDGCVADVWKLVFDNHDRTDATKNEDWFTMRPLTHADDCKAKWIIDCTVASCKRGLEKTNEQSYNEFCKAGSCDRYKTGFFNLNARKRRSLDQSDESPPAEAHVQTTFVHPCYFVDEQTTEYCITEDKCWTLEQCTSQFPLSFSNSDIDDLMTKIRLDVQEHIDQVLATTENPNQTHEHIMENIRDIANRFIYHNENYADAVEDLKELIQTL